MRWLLVIARNSSFTYKGRAVDVKQIGRELGVRYVLEGSVRKAGNRVRVTGQLIDAVTGAHLWADRFDGGISDVFDFQDRITENVVAALEPKIELAEIERLKREPPANVDAYDLLLRALQLEHEFTDESLAAAVRCLEEALAKDPSYAPAMALAAYCYAERHNQGWVRDPESEAKWLRAAWHAVELGQDDGNVLWMAAYAVWRLGGDPKRAKELASRSLLINPNSTIALTMSGWMEATTANPERAFELIERARRLNPNTPRDWFVAAAMAMTCFAADRLDETILWADRALMQNRRFAIALRLQAAALAKRGELARAAERVQEILAIEPTLTVSALRARLTFQAQSVRDKYCDALRLAGLPE
jgi:tetratricopeptide (TPR) repeat protein